MITKNYDTNGVLFSICVELNGCGTTSIGLKNLIEELRSIANILDGNTEEFEFKEKE